MTDVIVAFPKTEDARAIRNILVKNGFPVMNVVTSGAGALSAADDLGGGILICSYQFPDMVYSELREDLNDRFSMLLICNPARITESLQEGIVFLPLPLKVHDLVYTVDMMSSEMMRRKKRKRASPAARSDEDRQTIEKAKALLMERNGMTEEEAHRYLQKCSMENGSNLVETSQMVISLNEA